MSIVSLLRDLDFNAILSLILVAFAWFVQRPIINREKRKYESYKLELDRKYESYKREFDSKPELLKGELDRQAREFQNLLDSKMELCRSELNFHSYKSTKIYDRQLNVMVDLYVMLVKLHRYMLYITRYPTGVEEERERRKNADNLLNDFDNHYFNNSILLPKTMADKMESLRAGYLDNYVTYAIGNDNKKQEKLDKIHKKIEDMKPSLDQLAEDFRRFIAAEKIGDLLK